MQAGTPLEMKSSTACGKSNTAGQVVRRGEAAHRAARVAAFVGAGASKGSALRRTEMGWTSCGASVKYAARLAVYIACGVVSSCDGCAKGDLSAAFGAMRRDGG